MHFSVIEKVFLLMKQDIESKKCPYLELYYEILS